MSDKKNFTDAVSADDKSIGFDYQYYYFLYKVLTMKKGENVGLEVRDDVHTDLANDHQLLIQVKHTIQEKKDETPKNLTTLDSDLWKTLSNWSKVISDTNAGRAESRDQLSFIAKTDFLLVSNKSATKGNDFVAILEVPSDVRSKLLAIRDTASGEKTLERIDDILRLDDEVLLRFVEHIRLELEVDAIIQQCKYALEEKQYPPNRIDTLFRNLDSQIRQDNFMAIRNGHKIEIPFEGFNKKYRRFFDIARSDELIIQSNYKPFPMALLEQTFIKQLRDIGDISDSDTNLIARYTLRMLVVESTLEYWAQQGDLTPEEIDCFKAEAKLHWENKFRSVYRSGNVDSSSALAVLDSMREVQLSIGDQSLGIEFSNGKYYWLSDIPEIGWLKDWEGKYK